METLRRKERICQILSKMSKVTLAQHVSDYYESILFGKPFDISKVPPTASLMIANIRKRHANVLRKDERNICGLNEKIEQDLDKLLSVLQENNEQFHSSRVLDDTREIMTFQSAVPHFETSIVQIFYYRLAKISGGSLDRGLSSNRAVYKTFLSIFGDGEVPNIFQHFVPVHDKDNEKLLQQMILGKPIGAVKFKNAQFWGTATQKLIEKKEAELNWIPSQKLEDLQKLYYITCRSMGQIIDPFMLHLSPIDSINPHHYSNGDYLMAFVRHNLSHPLSKSVRDICRRLIDAILQANNEHFPFGDFLYDSETLLQFMSNVNLIHDTIPQVKSRHIPPKLVDVVHRLLVLTKFEIIWKTVDSHKKENDNDNYFKLYLHVISLQTENAALKKIISNPEDKTLNVKWRF